MKSILTKLLVGTILPIILIFSLAAMLILFNVDNTVTDNTIQNLTAESNVAANQISEFFTNYQQTVVQMRNNDTVTNMFNEISKPGTSKAAESYASASKTFDNILAADSNISLVWSADFDSGESIRSGGVVRGLPDYDITTRDWYKGIVEKKKLFMTTYYDSTTGNLVTSVITPIFDSKNNLSACVAIDLTVDHLKTIMSQYKIGKNGFFVLATEEGLIIYHPNTDYIGKNISETDMSENIMTAVKNKSVGFYGFKNESVDCKGYLTNIGNTGWVVLSGLPNTEFSESSTALRNIIFAIFLAGLILMVIIITLIALGIIKPLKLLTKAANNIADGNLDVMLDIHSKDETGQVSNAINRTVIRLKDYINYINEITSILDEISAGNLNYSLTLDYVGDFKKIKTALINISSSLSDTLYQINQASDQVSSGSEQVSAGAQALSQGATEQASSIEELSATISDIAEMIKQNADHTKDANKAIQTTERDLTEGSHQMYEMTQAMDKISKSSTEIAKIIKTIDDIASQTNILALNAAVEAARAGSAGKGFSVVADEVRNLAGKSAQAAKNTTSLIENSIKAVEEGSKIASNTADSLKNVVVESAKITELIKAISERSTEQAEAAEQITRAVDQISIVVQTNSATAEESAAASEELSGQAHILKNLIGNFKLNSNM